ncbi:hypothetical protein Vadar_008471 [Vaccinium darrowii]|nr:hypothetical protein Vadar_008471 [Vaccinium darrowii]
MASQSVVGFVGLDELSLELAASLLRSGYGVHAFEVRTYEEHCGPLSRYGRRYTRAIANMCNAGVKVEQMAMASATACHA